MENVTIWGVTIMSRHGTYKLSAQKVHWWVPLVEKGYAKFCGSYENIDGGFPRYSMYHLTGGVCADINLTGQNKRRANYLFDLLHSLVKTKLVILNAGNMGDSEVENRIFC